MGGENSEQVSGEINAQHELKLCKNLKFIT